MTVEKVTPLKKTIPGEVRIPFDVISEGIIVAAAFHDEERPKLLATLSVDDFHEPKHRAMWTALGALHQRGLSFDIDTLAKVGDIDAGYAGTLATTHPTVSDNLAFHVKQIEWDARRFRAVEGPVHQLLKALRNPLTTPDLVRVHAREVQEAFGEPAKEQGLTGIDIAKPIGRLPWLSREMGLIPGRVVLLFGVAGVSKTILAQELELSVASGRGECWGGVELQGAGPVIHFDYEVGELACRLRFQRLAHSMKVDVAELGERIELVCFPDHNLVSPNAYDFFRRRLEGKKLAVIDSFTASTGDGIDQNSAAVRPPLDMLSRVSSETGCVIVVIHHAGKPSKDTPERSKLQLLRGSSGFADAAGAAICVVASDGAIEIEQCKPVLTAAPSGPRMVKLLDEEGKDPETEMSLGLAVVQMSAEHVEQAKEEKAAGINEALVAKAAAKMLEVLRARQPINKEDLLTLTGGKTDHRRRALAQLKADGVVDFEVGKSNAHFYRIVKEPVGGQQKRGSR